MEKQHEEKGVTIDGGQVENIVALTVHEEGISPRLKQQIHNVVVASLSCPHCRCCARLSTFGIDIGAGFDEEVARRVLIVDGRPLLTGYQRALDCMNLSNTYVKGRYAFRILIFCAKLSAVEHVL